MGKSKRKSTKNKKRFLNNDNKEKRELIFKENGQEYAQILKMLGNGRCLVYCFDGLKRLCHIRGKLKRKVWISPGDIVLIGLRDFQDAKGDIIFKYSTEESRCLKAYGELPSSISLNENSTLGFESNDVVTKESVFEFEN